MAISERHDYCACLSYRPSFAITGIRFDGSVFRCRKCCAYVDGTKWLGGIVHFGNRSRFVKYYECPCCGYRMSTNRRGKCRTVRSVERQINDPNIQPAVKKQLPFKIKILKKMHLPPMY